MSEPAEIAVTSILALLIIANIIGNCLVCLVIKKYRDMRTPINYLLANLAASDIVFALFIAPNHVLKKSFNHPDNTIGSVLCKVLTGGNVAWIGVASSALTLVVISVERFYTVTSPVSSNAKLTMRKVKTIIPACWSIGALFSIPIFLVTTYDKTSGKCKWNWHEQWMGAVYDTIWLVLLALIPLLVMTGLYSKVVYMLWFKRNEENELAFQRKGVLKVRKRVTLSMITVSAIFGACWITGLLVYILSHLDIFIFGSVSYVVSDTLFMFNSAINPYIYALLNERFRQKLRLLCSANRTPRVYNSS